jgi:hypothetical protein
MALLRERRTYVTVANIHHYFRLSPRPPAGVRRARRFAISSPVSDAKSGDILRAGMLETFPSLSDVGIDYCWGGLVDVTQDRLPARRRARRPVLFDRLQRPRHADVGADGRAHGRGDGRRCLRQSVGGRDWRAIPGHLGPPWFLPAVGLYFRLKDRFAEGAFYLLP